MAGVTEKLIAAIHWWECEHGKKPSKITIHPKYYGAIDVFKLGGFQLNMISGGNKQGMVIAEIPVTVSQDYEGIIIQ